MSVFESCQSLPPDPILELSRRFKEDRRKNKLDLGAGVYRSKGGETHLFSAVAKAEARISKSPKPKSYVPIEGNQDLKKLSQSLLLSDEILTQYPDVAQRFTSFQTLGGTGALSLVAAFCKNRLGINEVYISDPSWPNHLGIFKNIGISVRKYPYLDEKTNLIDFCALMNAFDKTPINGNPVDEDRGTRTAVVLQVCGHNPTGQDLTKDQWVQLLSRLKHKNVVPIMDLAYQGLADGLVSDIFPVQYLLSQNNDFFVAHSLSKSMGLYGERLGFLHIVSSDPSLPTKISAEVKSIIRTMYSSPPIHCAELFKIVMTDENLKELWLTELDEIRCDLTKKRKLLFKAFHSHGIPGTWDRIIQDKGLFSLLGISCIQCDLLESEYGIYIPRDGRINIGGVDEDNVEYFCDSLKNVIIMNEKNESKL